MADTSDETRGVCFVVMGFGKKTDFESGRTLDLDKTYRNIIEPAVKDANLKCIRADDIVHSGVIDVWMYEQLLDADVVVADLSTANNNAFYELGVRHALRPYTTIVIAEDGMKRLPFDVNHVVVRQYHHLGEDIGYDEVIRFRKALTDAINEILKTQPPKNDSPVYTFLHGLNPPLRGASGGGPSAAADVPAFAAAEVTRGSQPAASGDTATATMLMQQADDAQERGDFVTAKTLLSTVRGLMKVQYPDRPEDPTLLQRLALATYKSKYPTAKQALEEASAFLQVLEPETSNDTETLGLCGAIQKRRWEETKDKTCLDQAIRAYGRGFYLRNDYYNGINLAYLLNVRAANAASRAEAIADFVDAERIRKEVLSICESLLDDKNLSDAAKYWVRATMAEAYVGLGDENNANQILQEAYQFSPEGWMKSSTDEQLTKLRSLLVDSPLKYVNNS
jgi:tetratricopeptide (TPR) repeat protein